MGVELLGRAAVALLGMGLIVMLILSLMRTAIVNARSHDPMAVAVTRAAHAIVGRLQHSRATKGSAQRMAAWFMPLFILVLIFTWFMTGLVGFAALYWATGAEKVLGGAFVASGSALTTLGFATPANTQGHVLGILQGALGLVIVVFILTFVPGYQGAVQARELQAAWLYRRVGATPTAVDVLCWLARNMDAGSHDAFWATWEGWFRQIRATHVLAPEVIYTPSVFPGQSWITCAGVILDAAALQVAAVDPRPAAAPHMCLAEGIDTLCAVVQTIGYADASQPSPAVQAEPADFVPQLAAADLQLRPDLESAWPRFADLRTKYAGPLHYLSSQTLTDDYFGFAAQTEIDTVSLG